LIPSDSAQKTGSKSQERYSKSSEGDSHATMTGWSRLLAQREQLALAGMELCLIAIISMSALIHHVTIRLLIASHMTIEEETSSKAS
jgi:hypothetical protein